MSRIWYACRVMLHQARRDPLWALGCLFIGPLRGGAYALKVLFIAAFLTLALLALVEFGVDALRIRKSLIHSGLNIGVIFIGVAFLFRMALTPMVETFGHGYAADEDSHGSARFATKAERASLTNVAPEH